MGKRSLEDMMDAEKMPSNGDAMVRFIRVFFWGKVIARVQTGKKNMETVSRLVVSLSLSLSTCRISTSYLKQLQVQEVLS